MGDDQSALWLPLGEAAERLGTTVDAVRARVRRGTLESRRGNDKHIQVMVPAAELDQAAPRRDADAHGRDEADALLRDEALAEAERDMLRQAEVALRRDLDHGLAEHARLAAEHAEARKPLLVQLVETLARAAGWAGRGGLSLLPAMRHLT